MLRALGSQMPVISCATQMCASVRSRSPRDFNRSRNSIAFSEDCLANRRRNIARGICVAKSATEITHAPAHLTRRPGQVSLQLTFRPVDGAACASSDSASGFFQSSRSTMGNRLPPFRLLPGGGQTPRRLKRTFRKRYNAFPNRLPKPPNTPCS